MFGLLVDQKILFKNVHVLLTIAGNAFIIVEWPGCVHSSTATVLYTGAEHDKI